MGNNKLRQLELAVGVLYLLLLALLFAEYYEDGKVSALFKCLNKLIN